MIVDALYKLTRKLMPTHLYRRISRSVFGREKSWKTFETYTGTFKSYSDRNIDFSGKRILEVGCGDQFYTAFFFLAAGATEVLLAEPSLVFDKAKIAQKLLEFNEKNGTKLALEETINRIRCFKDLADVPSSYDAGVDAAFSFLVLEHFHELESFFLHTGRLLHDNGQSSNLVDLSDHTYHIFTKFTRLGNFARRRFLYHLRYSTRMFALINDPKCFMNRKLLPEYLELAEKNGLKVSKISKEIDDSAVLHPDLILKHSNAEPRDLKAVNFYLQLEKNQASQSVK